VLQVISAIMASALANIKADISSNGKTQRLLNKHGDSTTCFRGVNLSSPGKQESLRKCCTSQAESAVYLMGNYIIGR
jgi:hypothetical protein